MSCGDGGSLQFLPSISVRPIDTSTTVYGVTAVVGGINACNILKFTPKKAT